MRPEGRGLTPGFVLLFCHRDASIVASAAQESGSPALASSVRVADVPPPSMWPVPTLLVSSWSPTTGHTLCPSPATDTSRAARQRWVVWSRRLLIDTSWLKLVIIHRIINVAPPQFLTRFHIISVAVSKCQKQRACQTSISLGQTVISKHKNLRYYSSKVTQISSQTFYEVMFDDGSFSNDTYPEDIVVRLCLVEDGPDGSPPRGAAPQQELHHTPVCFHQWADNDEGDVFLLLESGLCQPGSSWSWGSCSSKMAGWTVLRCQISRIQHLLHVPGTRVKTDDLVFASKIANKLQRCACWSPSEWSRLLIEGVKKNERTLETEVEAGAKSRGENGGRKG